MFKTLNQVGGSLGDYIVQAAIGDKTALEVIDGFGGLVGYDLDNIDSGSGPIRERAYEIICANLEPGSLLLQSLRQINAVKEMPLYEWILEMDAIYFDINPEMGLQAQQDFQTLVYEYLYAIISFCILFSQYASGYGFYQQFLNNDGVPFRMKASVFLQQLRTALTARCGHFVKCFRRFDEDTATLKAARSTTEVTADKQVITYKRIGKLKTSIMATYNEKRKYGIIPEPHSCGSYPVADTNGIFANAAVVHHSPTQPDVAAPAPAPAPAPSSRGTQRCSTPTPAPAPATDGRKYVNAKTITNPVEITAKGKTRWISARLLSPAKRKTSF
jgi:hypothetical protein